MTPLAAFEHLNRIVGLAPLTVPIFEGNEAHLPTPFRASSAAAASLTFSAAVASEIWRLRGGEKQSIAIDMAAAAATLVSSRLARKDGEALPPPLPGNPVTGFYQSADRRWLHLHGGFGFETPRLLDLLNAKNDAGSILEGVSKWNGFALEDAIAFMQLCGTVALGEEEWNASIQGRVMAASPVIRLTKIGDAPPLRLPKSRTPLAGLRVLDVTRVLAGPLCSRILASHGAEVLRINSGHLAAIPAYDLDTGAGKRMAQLDLRKPADAESLRRLVREADVFVDSYRPGALAKLGFSPAALALISPGMTYVAVSAYGAEGPWAGRRGWEQSAQVATGLAAVQGAFAAARRKTRRDTLPELIDADVCATLAGHLAAAGAAAALLRRIREGGSWLVQVSLAGAAMWLRSLGTLDPARVPEAWDPNCGLDPYIRKCETKEGVFELLGPVVRMSKTPPLWTAPSLPGVVSAAGWSLKREDANAA